MILSQTTEYAIRAISTLALKDAATRVGAKQLNAETEIPLHYLSKVLRKLVTADLLVATKGHNGGFALARPAHKIRIIQVIEAVESEVPPKHCIFGWRICNSKDPCILHNRWSAVNDAFQEWARRTSLADIKEDALESGWLARTPGVKRGK